MGAGQADDGSALVRPVLAYRIVSGPTSPPNPHTIYGECTHTHTHTHTSGSLPARLGPLYSLTVCPSWSGLCWPCCGDFLWPHVLSSSSLSAALRQCGRFGSRPLPRCWTGCLVSQCWVLAWVVRPAVAVPRLAFLRLVFGLRTSFRCASPAASDCLCLSLFASLLLRLVLLAFPALLLPLVARLRSGLGLCDGSGVFCACPLGSGNVGFPVHSLPPWLRLSFSARAPGHFLSLQRGCALFATGFAIRLARCCLVGLAALSGFWFGVLCLLFLTPSCGGNLNLILKISA